MKQKTLRAFMVVPIAAALMVGAVFSTAATAAEVTRYISVSATGTTLVVPDAVRINATVSVIGKTSKAALATASGASAQVRKVLAVNKIATKDIATQSISVHPEYLYPQDGSAPVLNGYRASQGFSIVVRAATTAGAIIDDMVDAGGDNLQINNAAPFVLNSEKAVELARENAVKRAKAKALSYAKFLGVRLGKVVYLIEEPAPNEFIRYSAMDKADGSETQIDLGQQKVSITVTVRWGL